MQKVKDLVTKIYHINIHPLAAVIPLCLWGLFRRALWRYKFDLWLDERGQVKIIDTGSTFWEFVQHLPKIEFAAYLSGDHYMLYPFVKTFGANKWALAAPHILITILGFYLLYLISKKYLKSIWGYIIVFAIIAYNDTLRQHAFEIRPYAVLPNLALACFYLQYKLIFKNETVTAKQKWAIGLFFVISILWHAYGVLITFLPALYFFGTIIRKPQFKNVFKKVALFYIPVIIIASPIWLISVFGQHLTVHNFGNSFIWTPNPIVAPIAFLKFIFGNLMGYRNLYFLLGGLVLAFLLPLKERYKIMAFFLVLVAFPLALLFFADVRAGYHFIQRQWVWVIPYFALYMGVCWEALIQYFIGAEKTLP